MSTDNPKDVRSTDDPNDVRSADSTDHHGLVMRLAYDICGSWADAEDVAQTVHLRWLGTSGVVDPRAYLARMTVNAALDVVRRRDYRGPELPEPLPAAAAADAGLEQAEEVEFALATVLHTLTPLERTVFLLHEVFDFSHPEIAAMLERTPAAVRQLGHRAQAHVRAARPRFEADAREVAALAERFFAAAREGDLAGLLDLLAEDVTLVADGGGRRAAAVRPLLGHDAVARFVLGLAAKFLPAMSIEAAVLNGAPAWVLREADGQVDQAVWFEASGGRIVRVLTVRDPRKLGAVQRDLDARG